MKVERSGILEAALALLNEVGVDALSTRLLAQRLGVQQPALYWHFKSKRDLLDAMNGEIIARGHLRRTPLADEDWRSFLRANVHSFRKALLAYRDGARIHAGTEAPPDDVAVLERQLAIFVEAGMTPGEALELLIGVGRYAVGCVLEEQVDAPADPALDEAAAGFPLLAQAMAHYRANDHAALFAAGLDLMIEGAAAKLGAKAG